MSENASLSLLLALPDPCLLAVLQFCAADNQRSLFCAARAHSRLHQAAVLALPSITANLKDQQQVDSVLLYLSKHDQCSSIDISSNRLDMHNLPPCPRLNSLQLSKFQLLLQPGEQLSGFEGVLKSGQPLKQLQLTDCKLLDGIDRLAAALEELPSLEHLSIRRVCFSREYYVWPACLHMDVLQQLTHLTYLELDSIRLEHSEQGQPALQPLTALTRLLDLRLHGLNHVKLTAAMLAAACALTCLMLYGVSFEPDALAGKALLQHLHLERCSIKGSAAQLLPQLQHLQQLTHLELEDSLAQAVPAVNGGNPIAAAYAALTASSKLQHLSINEYRLPAGLWQLLFPAGRLLPHLQSLSISSVGQPDGSYAVAPEGSGIALCCPGLQSLDMRCLQCPLEQLAPLQGLSELRKLRLATVVALTEAELQAVCQLTGLRELELNTADTPGMLLQLTQLRQLTSLHYYGQKVGAGRRVQLVDQVD
jgi:hypothetical protein